MQTYETLHIVTDGNGIIGKWVVDPLCNGNGKIECQIQNMHFAIALAVAMDHHVNSLICLY